jgi:hypothetical protein
MIAPRIAYLPATDEKIEGQIVDPSSEHYPSISNKQHDVAERVESTLVAAPVGDDQRQVKGAQESRHQQTCYQRGDDARGASGPSRHYQQEPTGKRSAVAKSKK